jgi:peptidylprolyl isomerase
MAEAKLGDTVKVHYTGKFDDGTVFDSSEGGDPLEFTIGSGQLIQGFDNAVIGMNTGESKTEKIESDHAYGPRTDQMIVTVERTQLPDDMEPEIGQPVQLQDQSGRPVPAVISDITETTVTFDANHPLAGRDLVFEITLVEIG